MKNYSKLKNYMGIIVPKKDKLWDEIALLTPNGECLPIIKNELFDQLRRQLWESVSLIGKVHHHNTKTWLEVKYFSIHEELASSSEVEVLETIHPEKSWLAIDQETMSA